MWPCMMYAKLKLENASARCDMRFIFHLLAVHFLGVNSGCTHVCVVAIHKKPVASPNQNMKWGEYNMRWGCKGWLSYNLNSSNWFCKCYNRAISVVSVNFFMSRMHPQFTTTLTDLLSKRKGSAHWRHCGQQSCEPISTNEQEPL